MSKAEEAAAQVKIIARAAKSDGSDVIVTTDHGQVSIWTYAKDARPPEGVSLDIEMARRLIVWLFEATSRDVSASGTR